MVHMIEANKDIVQKDIASKRVICFGAGRRLEYFRKNNPELKIAGIIDNYKNSDYLDINNGRIPVWYPEEASCKIDRDTIIVITSIAIEEIVDQMDKMKKFDGVSCYAEVAIDDYIGLKNNQKLWIKKLISRLANRTYESILKDHYGEQNLVSVIKKYQIWEYINMSYTAGSKARIDIKKIIGDMGYQVMNMHCRSGNKEEDEAEGCDKLVKADWKYFLSIIPEYSIVFIQSPTPSEMIFPKDTMFHIKEEKHIRFVCLLHDVESLRRQDVSLMRQDEFEFIKEISDMLIVHNDVMKKYFERSGVKKSKIITLEIFDYLHEGVGNNKVFEKTINFAGNLSREKSPFLDQIGELSPLKFRLYGPDFSVDIFSKADNIEYCGSYAAEILPQKLDRGFGLIWDGGSLDTCAGRTGEYLRYINPHKMSLYLSAGLPVIIWSGAAQAGFVREKQVGIIVDSLYDIKDVLDRMDEEWYFTLAENARKISGLLKSGYYTRQAVEKIEEIFEND